MTTFTVIVLINGEETEELKVLAKSRDDAFVQAMRTYDAYLNRGYAKSYQIKEIR